MGKGGGGEVYYRYLVIISIKFITINFVFILFSHI